MINRGEIVRLAVVKSGMPKTRIAQRLGVHRNTIDNWFTRPDLEIEKILEIGKVIGYDFSEEINEMNKDIKVLKEPISAYNKLTRCEQELHRYMSQVIDLLEENTRLKAEIIRLNNS
jgi:uncharacterized protein YjcR